MRWDPAVRGDASVPRWQIRLASKVALPVSSRRHSIFAAGRIDVQATSLFALRADTLHRIGVDHQRDVRRGDHDRREQRNVRFSKRDGPSPPWNSLRRRRRGAFAGGHPRSGQNDVRNRQCTRRGHRSDDPECSDSRDGQLSGPRPMDDQAS